MLYIYIYIHVYMRCLNAWFPAYLASVRASKLDRSVDVMVKETENFHSCMFPIFAKYKSCYILQPRMPDLISRIAES